MRYAGVGSTASASLGVGSDFRTIADHPQAAQNFRLGSLYMMILYDCSPVRAVKRHTVDPRNRQRGPVFSASQVLIKD